MICRWVQFRRCDISHRCSWEITLSCIQADKERTRREKKDVNNQNIAQSQASRTRVLGLSQVLLRG